MKLFDAGQHALGFIAVGQQATGFFALGQMATGVVAVGQIARGVIAIGQVSFGLVGWGMVSGGVLHAFGMLGVGGRGLGPVLRLVPAVGRPRVMPPSTTLAAVEAGEPGWIAVDLSADLGLHQGETRLPIKVDRRLQRRGAAIAAERRVPVLAYTRRTGAVLVCERIAFAPPRPFRTRGFWVLAGFQLAGLLALGTAYAGVVGGDLLTGLDKVFADAPSPPARPPLAPPRPVKGRGR